MINTDKYPCSERVAIGYQFLQHTAGTRNRTGAEQEQNTRSPLIDLRRAIKSTKRRSSSVSFSLKLSFSLSSYPLLFRAISCSLRHPSDFPFPIYAHQDSVYSCDGTHSARWAKVRELRARRMNSVFVARRLDSPL